ncbi:MAG: carbon storage regulator, partial [Gammaproteobacteria bacterium]
NHHLVLSRYKGEKIIIAIDLKALSLTASPVDECGTLLTISTHDICSGHVKLDFYAPKWVKIWREEIW